MATRANVAVRASSASAAAPRITPATNCVAAGPGGADSIVRTALTRSPSASRRCEAARASTTSGDSAGARARGASADASGIAAAPGPDSASRDGPRGDVTAAALRRRHWRRVTGQGVRAGPVPWLALHDDVSAARREAGHDQSDDDRSPEAGAARSGRRLVGPGGGHHGSRDALARQAPSAAAPQLGAVARRSIIAIASTSSTGGGHARAAGMPTPRLGDRCPESCAGVPERLTRRRCDRGFGRSLRMPRPKRPVADGLEVDHLDRIELVGQRWPRHRCHVGSRSLAEALHRAGGGVTRQLGNDAGASLASAFDSPRQSATVRSAKACAASAR